MNARQSAPAPAGGFRIGPVAPANPTVLAPLAGITDLPLRLMAKEAGCALVYSEMVSAYGLHYGSAKTRTLMKTTGAEAPLAIQIFGSDPEIMAEAAVMAAEAGAAIVDINFGCAVRKILKSGSGAALMREPDRARAVLTAVRRAISVALTIKIRSGWDPSGADAETIARLAQDCGVDAIAVHPRTARQGFGGRADWKIIARLKKILEIPVIGNGDINSAEDALEMIRTTGCDAVMIGRAAVGNPFIFTQVIAALEGRRIPQIGHRDRIAVMRRYARAAVCYLGEKTACFVLRSRLGWFVKGLPQATRFRRSIRHLRSEEHIMELIDAYEQILLAGGDGS